MEKRTINNLTFICGTKSNRSGFKHTCTLFHNDNEVLSTSIQYYNRTWECYRYQTIMKSAILDTINTMEKKYTKMYKERNNIKRLTKAKKEIMLDSFSKIELVQELKEAYKEL